MFEIKTFFCSVIFVLLPGCCEVDHVGFNDRNVYHLYAGGMLEEVLEEVSEDSSVLMVESEEKSLLEITILDEEWFLARELLPFYIEGDMLEEDVFFLLLSRPGVEACKLLRAVLEQRDWVNLHHADEEWSAIELAAINYNYQAVEILLEKGADIYEVSLAYNLSFLHLVDYYYCQTFDMTIQPPEDGEWDADWRVKRREYWRSLILMLASSRGVDGFSEAMLSALPEAEEASDDELRE